jgi:DNA (cytosine-5)-methyltransferase 1
MFWEFIRVISELRPRAFLMENVAGLTHRHNWRLLQSIVQSLVDLGYRCGGDVVRATDYGVPQLRHRFVLVGLRGSHEPVLFPRPTHGDRDQVAKSRELLPHVSIKKAIGDLPEIPSGGGTEVATYDKRPFSAYQAEARRDASALYNHRASAVASINLRRISFVSEGGNWKDIPCHLLPPRFFNCRLTDHSTTYARPRWDHPSFTLTALFGNVTAGAYTHPSQDRAFSVREGARIHSFPDRFRFRGPLNSQYRQIGNAVPPLLGESFGRHIGEYLGSGKFADDSVLPRLSDEFILGARWEDVPVMTSRYRDLFGAGTRWPAGWGDEPLDRGAFLTDNYRLKSIPGLAAVA